MNFVYPVGRPPRRISPSEPLPLNGLRVCSTNSFHNLKTTMPLHFLGISGSLRKGSYNTMLLKTALSLVPEGITTEKGDFSDFPLYNYDVETSAYPPAVSRLKE